jgi:branched-chain amino acid transport system permease protein
MASTADSGVRRPRSLRASGTGGRVGPAGLIAAIAAMAVLPLFVSGSTTDLLVRALIFGVLAMSLDVLWGYLGILSLGHSAFFGIGAYCVGIAGAHFADTSGAPILGFVGAVVISVVVAGIIGWAVFSMNARPLYLAVMTLSVALVLERLAALTQFEALAKYTGGFNGLSGFSIVEWTTETWYWVMLTLVVVVGVGAWVLMRSDFGRVVIGIRNNENRLKYLGYSTSAVKLGVFVGAAAVAAIAGGAYASYARFVSPDLLGLEIVTYLIVLIAIGGRGTLIGPVIGALILGLVGPKISADYPFQWDLILGLGFLAVVVLAPSGLVPLVARLVRRVRGSSSRTDAGSAGNGGWRLEARDDDPDAKRGVRDGALRITGLKKAFGSLQVLRGVDLVVEPAQIVGIIGPNGAGKSTLVSCISDARDADAGEISLGEHRLNGSGPDAIVQQGIGRTFQGADVFSDLTVGESLFLARERGRLPSPIRRSRVLTAGDSLVGVLEATGLIDDLDRLASDLPHGRRQALELSMALALQSRMLLLDEPTAGLSVEERTRIGGVLARLKAEHGIGMVLIEHDLDFVKEITEKVAVLHQGEVRLFGPVAEVAASPLVREIYLGAVHDDASA